MQQKLRFAKLLDKKWIEQSKIMAKFAEKWTFLTKSTKCCVWRNKRASIITKMLYTNSFARYWSSPTKSNILHLY